MPLLTHQKTSRLDSLIVGDGENEKIVVTFGTCDLFHVGHLKILQRASKLGDKLYVGVSTDRLNYEKKQRYPVIDQESRKLIVSNIKGVTGVFNEDSLEKKRQYLIDHHADILVMGDDWESKFDHLSDIVKVNYHPRTDGISTTKLIKEVGDLIPKDTDRERMF